MNVELVLATRMLKRASVIYILCPLLFLIRSQNAFVTSLASSIILQLDFIWVQSSCHMQQKSH